MGNKVKRYCLITGATGGVGRSLVEHYSNSGYEVIATDIVPRPSSLYCSRFIQADLDLVAKDEDYANNIFDQIKQYLDGNLISVIINNAALQIISSTEDLTRNDWNQTINVNLIAPFILCQAFLLDLEKTKGCVINISSIHAQHTKKNFIAYATSKAALTRLTSALALDLGGKVRVLGIEPAAVETDMLRASFVNNRQDYEGLNALHPLGRIGRPEEIAKLAYFISDGNVEFLNGVCIRIDGGISARLVDPQG